MRAKALPFSAGGITIQHTAMTYEQAIEALSRRNFTPAIATILGHLRDNPCKADAWLYLGVAYSEAGLQDAALEALDRAELLLNEPSAELCEAFGCTLLRLKRYGEARSYLQTALNLPNCPASAYRNLGVLEFKVGDLVAARELVETARDRGPDDLHTLYARIVVLDRLLGLQSHGAHDMLRAELREALTDILGRPGLPKEMAAGATRRLTELDAA